MKRQITLLTTGLLAVPLALAVFAAPASAAPAGGCPARAAYQASVSAEPAATAPDATTGTNGTGSAIIKITGTVVEGVEHGCLLLKADDGGLYLLIGGDPKVITVGAILRITGYVRGDVASYCMQGQPFQVGWVEVLG